MSKVITLSKCKMKKAELVFIPAPGVSHLVAKIEFAKRLLEHDDRFSITVLIITPPYSNAPNWEEHIQSLATYKSHIKLLHLPHVDPPPPELLMRSVEKYCSALIESYKTHVKEAIINHVLLNTSIQLAGLVVDMFCTSLIDVAHELGVPSYVFFPCNAAFLGFTFYLPTRHDQVGTEFIESGPELVIPSYVNPVPTGVLPSFAFNKEGGYLSFVDHGRKFKETKGIIVNTFLELESHAVSSFLNDGMPPVYTVGPLINLQGQTHLGTNQTEHDEIMKWLDDQPLSSVVFLCFGSGGSFGAPQLKEIALGLERSGHRFLWSIRCASPDDKLAKPIDKNLYLQEMLPQGFLDRTKEIGMICGWAPQVEVLAHQSIGGFVSHCGWNSILESLWHGVPLVTWPLYAEQQINAFEMVKDLGLAVEMKLDSRSGGELVMAEEIMKAVKCVIEGDNGVRKRVKEMSEQSRKTVMHGGSSFASLGQLIEYMLGNIVPMEK